MPVAGRYLGVRSVIETPILDDRKWAKVPSIPADGFLVDMEDSVPPPLKDRARARVVEYLRQPDYFGGALVIARPNHLDTAWGRNDVEALADAGVTCIAYPKCGSAPEVLEVQELFRSKGADPDIFASIETARGVLEATNIASLDKVVSIGIGVGDLSADIGVPLFGPDGELNEVFTIAKAQIALAGAAFDCLRGDLAFAPNLYDRSDVRRRYEMSRRLGFTMGYTFYPPHVPIINEVFGVSEDDLLMADQIIERYEAAIGSGVAAIASDSGGAILVHDYHKAVQVRARHEAIAARERTG
jgi:citrate lyase beta subunit